MGKLLPSTGQCQRLAKIVSTHKPKPTKTRPVIPSRPSEVRVDSEQLRLKNKMEENRAPLSCVVSDCVKRWFQDTLKEAKTGDTAMQVLVGQMYFNGYGVPKDTQKGCAWINRASKSRASAWKVRDKHPGYNASDSDSDEVRGDDANKIR